MSQNNDDKPHSYTESAYTTVSSNTQTCGKFEIKSHYDFEPESAYKEVESSEPQEKYTCVDCGAEMDEGERKTFTVCEPCWDKAYAKFKPVSAPSESQEEMWHSWEEGAILGREVDIVLYDDSVMNNCIPQADGDFYYKPFNLHISFEHIKKWRYSFEELYN